MTGMVLGLYRISLPPELTLLTDGELLDRFLVNRDPIAFTALVHRHGRMVLGVCQRFLKNCQDAEDAFQATFLVLVVKAATISPRNAVGAWLYGVACRTAKKAHTMNLKRRQREQLMRTCSRSSQPPEDAWNQVQPLLDEELSALPEMYQSAIVLCDIEGRSKKEAAGLLCCPEGTLSSRLVRGRRILARRLARRGISLPASLLAVLLAQKATSAAVRAGLIVSTSQAATVIVGRQSLSEAAGMISERVSVLAQGVLKTMFLLRLKTGLVVLFIAGALGGVLALQDPRSDAAERPPTISTARAEDATPRNKPQDDPLQQQIARVLKAYGGEDRLEKLKNFSLKLKTTSPKSGQSEIHFLVQLPDRARLELLDEGNRAKYVAGRNRDEQWSKLNDDKIRSSSKPGFNAELLQFVGPRSLLKLKDPAMIATLLGERMAGDTAALLGDRPAICIKLKRKDGETFLPLLALPMRSVEEVLLYFDKSSGLLLKEEFNLHDEHFEIFHSEYKTIDGIPVAWKLKYKSSGEVTEVEFKIQDMVDEKMFDKP